MRDQLTPGGKLVFAHAPAVPGSYGVQGMYGFVDIDARIEPDYVGTLLVEALRTR